MKCRAQQQGFCLLQKNQITEVEINMLSVGPISRPREIFYLHFFFFFTFNFLLLSLSFARKLPLAWREGRGWGTEGQAEPSSSPQTHSTAAGSARLDFFFHLILYFILKSLSAGGICFSTALLGPSRSGGDTAGLLHTVLCFAPSPGP